MYIIVKEAGEYSGFEYENLEYYHTIEQAEYAIQLLDYELSLQNKLATLNCTWIDRCEYIIKEIPEGKCIQNEEEFCNEKQRIFDKYKDKIEQGNVNRINRETKAIETINLIKEERKQEVLEFWEWWNNGKEVDPYYDEKKQGKIRRILPIMYKYLAEDFHSYEMSEWFKKHYTY